MNTSISGCVSLGPPREVGVRVFLSVWPQMPFYPSLTNSAGVVSVVF